MGHLLDILDGRVRAHQGRAVESGECEISEKNERSPDFFRLSRFSRTPSLFAAALQALERRCPGHVEAERWHQAVEDGCRFVAQWGDQAGAFGWTADDLFGLAEPPERPSLLYRRLSRYDTTGLIWILRGRPVIALTADIAVIATSNGGRLSFFLADRRA